jgi:hypothetical protein
MTFIGKIATFWLRQSPAGEGLALDVKDFPASSVEQHDIGIVHLTRTFLINLIYIRVGSNSLWLAS